MPNDLGRHEEMAKILRERYSPMARDDTERVLDALSKALSSARSRNLSINAFLNEIAKTIHRLFEFKEIAIGLRSRPDNLYRYEVLLGFRGDVEKAHRNLAYTHQEMMDSDAYPGGIRIGKNFEILLVEMQPFITGEESTYNRPSKLRSERESPDDFVEGDYIDIYMFGRENDLIGWIELSGTRSGKLPSRATMKWLEFVASLIAGYICEKDTARKIC